MWSSSCKTGCCRTAGRRQSGSTRMCTEEAERHADIQYSVMYGQNIQTKSGKCFSKALFLLGRDVERDQPDLLRPLASTARRRRRFDCRLGLRDKQFSAEASGGHRGQDWLRGDDGSPDGVQRRRAVEQEGGGNDFNPCQLRRHEVQQDCGRCSPSPPWQSGKIIWMQHVWFDNNLDDFVFTLHSPTVAVSATLAWCASACRPPWATLCTRTRPTASVAGRPRCWDSWRRSGCTRTCFGTCAGGCTRVDATLRPSIRHVGPSSSRSRSRRGNNYCQTTWSSSAKVWDCSFFSLCSEVLSRFAILCIFLVYSTASCPETVNTFLSNGEWRKRLMWRFIVLAISLFLPRKYFPPET